MKVTSDGFTANYVNLTLIVSHLVTVLPLRQHRKLKMIQVRV